MNKQHWHEDWQPPLRILCCESSHLILFEKSARLLYGTQEEEEEEEK